MADTTSSSNTNKASSTAELMARQKAQPISLKRGDIVKGTIKKLTRLEILLNINAKSDALVLERDKKLLNRMLKTLKVGDEVTVTVLNPESDTGSPLVSLRKFIGDIAWQELEALQKKGEQFSVTVVESTKGGYVVAMDNGLSGFLPFSHASYLQGQQLSPGQKVKASLLEIIKQENKIIFSQKSMVGNEEFITISKKYKVGQKISATVTNITPFGVFAGIQVADTQPPKTIDGLIHISEISWKKVDDISSLYKTGEILEVVIIGFDTQTKRFDLSIKRLTQDPFDEVAKQFPIDTKVTGSVSKVSDGNVYVSLAEGIEGVIRKEKIPPNVSYQEGSSITVTIADIDKRRHRIDLVPVLLEKPIGYR